MSVLDNSPPKRRPVYLNLVAIRLPIAGIASFLHRVSGAVLFLFVLPLMLLAVEAGLDGTVVDAVDGDALGE